MLTIAVLIIFVVAYAYAFRVCFMSERLPIHIIKHLDTMHKISQKKDGSRPGHSFHFIYGGLFMLAMLGVFSSIGIAGCFLILSIMPSIQFG